jgi:hypothetical protein
LLGRWLLFILGYIWLLLVFVRLDHNLTLFLLLLGLLNWLGNDLFQLMLGLLASLYLLPIVLLFEKHVLISVMLGLLLYPLVDARRGLYDLFLRFLLLLLTLHWYIGLFFVGLHQTGLRLLDSVLNVHLLLLFLRLLRLKDREVIL